MRFVVDRKFLEAQLLSKYIDVTDSLRTSLNHGTFSCLRCLWFDCDVFFQFCNLEFDKEAISDDFIEHYRIFREQRFKVILRLSFCSPFFISFICSIEYLLRYSKLHGTPTLQILTACTPLHIYQKLNQKHMILFALDVIEAITQI